MESPLGDGHVVLVVTFLFVRVQLGRQWEKGVWAESTRCLLSAQATHTRAPCDLSWLSGAALCPGLSLSACCVISNLNKSPHRNFTACNSRAQMAWCVQVLQGSRQRSGPLHAGRVCSWWSVCHTPGCAGALWASSGSPQHGEGPLRLVLRVPRAQG